MHLVVTGLSHNTAPVQVRERFSIPADQLPDALDSLRARNGILECLILSTCNRTEIYACAATKSDYPAITDWMSDQCGMPTESFDSHLYLKSGHKAVEHLMRVASGIDSLVVGEAQILGQVKTAYGAAVQAASTGTAINTLFQQAINVGKRVRTETGIGSGSFSVGSIAVQLANSIFSDLNGRTVLVIGAGEMAELAITHLIASGATRVMVANRTYERAAALAEQYSGTAVHFENLQSVLQTADIVITSTGSREPIITSAMMAQVMHARRGNPMFFVDIALPRDIAPGVENIDNVFVYNIDDLRGAVDAHAKERQVEVEKVQKIISTEVHEFMVKFRELDAVPVITALRDKFEGIRQKELEKLKSRLKDLTPEELEVIEVTTRSIVNKICHTPMIQIKDYAAAENPSATLDTICDLFGICPIEGEQKVKKE